MVDYPMQTLCIKCESPVDSGLFQLVRQGRPLCERCKASMAQEQNNLDDCQHDANFDQVKDGAHIFPSRD